MEILSAYDDERLAAEFGELTLHRAREYAVTGRVTELTVSEASSIVVLQAKVRGSGGPARVGSCASGRCSAGPATVGSRPARPGPTSAPCPRTTGGRPTRSRCSTR